MDAGGDVVRIIMDLAVAGFIKGFDFVKVKGRAEGLIKKLDGRHDISIAFVAGCKGLNGVDGLLDGIALLPINRAVAAGVVEAIL